MPQLSNLTASGLLYEGNFDEWLPRMRATLAHYGHCIMQTDSSGALHVRRSVWSVDGSDEDDVATIIWWHVSRDLRLRTPEERRDPTTLIRALRELARPFRIMDLPPELRLRIYLFNLGSCFPEYIWLLDPPRGPGGFRNTTEVIEEPILMSVNRQVRLEALPAYLKTISFNLSFDGPRHSYFYGYRKVGTF